MDAEIPRMLEGNLAPENEEEPDLFSIDQARIDSLTKGIKQDKVSDPIMEKLADVLKKL